MSFTGYLTQPELTELLDAFSQARLANSMSIQSLLQPIDPGFAGLVNGGAPLDYLWNILQAANREHNLLNGDVPLAQLLSAAATLSGPTKWRAVFEETLDRISYASPAPAAEAAVDSAAALAAAEDAEVTPEAQTNAIDQTVRVQFLSAGLAAAKSVVKILVQRHFDGVAQVGSGDRPELVNGTAWFIAPGLIITNHHVINARRKDFVKEPDASPGDFKLQADSAVIQFDYLDKDAEPPTQALGKDCLVASDQALDFALLRVPAALPARPALTLRKYPMTKTAQQALGSRVNLLQHPNGQPMRLGFRNNYILLGDDKALAYLTDTAIGSSGSPVCDDDWSVAALHSGSRGISDRNIEILGHTFRRENFGIPIRSILRHLEDKHRTVYDEIVAAQPG